MSIVKTLAFLILSNIVFEFSIPIDISNKCVFKDKTILSSCYWRGAWSTEELIIRDNEEFQSYGSMIKEDRKNCELASLPKIDFSKYSLLSKLTRGGCCSDKYNRRVLIDTLEKQIQYHIEVEYIGACEMVCGNFNWVLVPKIPKDYTVEFRVNEI